MRDLHNKSKSPKSSKKCLKGDKNSFMEELNHQIPEPQSVHQEATEAVIKAVVQVAVHAILDKKSRKAQVQVSEIKAVEEIARTRRPTRS